MSNLKLLVNVFLFLVAVIAGGIVYKLSKGILSTEYSFMISILSGGLVGFICSKIVRKTNNK
ncbi:hypothetical protein ACSLBF_03835 [Pseudoalteromonas sp. T1lg65]|uniref:hypothetical protein n=1 Tax=Pseudoalteromonas sp. T1lg65 TaxID=2077101 RepID=UPI003F795442